MKKYLAVRADPTPQDFLKLWKALFYCMWHSDKPLVQHELAAQIAQLVHATPTFETAELLLKTFWQTMAREWQGIDHHRLNKFLTLMRKVCHETFALLRESGWADERVRSIASLFAEGPLSLQVGASQTGIRTHVCDVFVPELQRAGCDRAVVTHELLEPFFAALGRTTDRPVLERIAESVLEPLARPEADPLAEEDDDDDAKPLAHDAARLAARLLALAEDEATPAQNRATLHALHDLFAEDAAEARPARGVAKARGAEAGGLASLQATLKDLVNEKGKDGKRKLKRAAPTNEMKLEVTTARKLAPNVAKLVKRGAGVMTAVAAAPPVEPAVEQPRAKPASTAARATPATPPRAAEAAAPQGKRGANARGEVAAAAAAEAQPKKLKVRERGAELAVEQAAVKKPKKADADAVQRGEADAAAAGAKAKAGGGKAGAKAEAGGATAEAGGTKAAAKERRSSVSFSPVLENVREYQMDGPQRRMMPMRIMRQIQQMPSPVRKGGKAQKGRRGR